MKSLSTGLRKQLERTVVQARDIAESGARVALEALAVHHHEPYGHMSPEQRKLRRRLRAHARHLGDRVDARTGVHTIDHLVQECAYEHWHGMLFARFLAENELLIEPELGVAISLDECEELAKEEGLDKWQLAARFAHRMLPQVFRPDHPVFEVQLAREYRLKLEDLVEGLPTDVFKASDALGWVYQFWQSKKKEEVNRSEVKIGADELPAVTQLFTEPYMVQFLLHNSLGAWWVSRHPDKPCPIDLAYLRYAPAGEEGSGEGGHPPAAGQFEGWPDDLSEFRLLDPCCGSGHFLVAAFLMLVPMRMTLEDLSAKEAVDAVLRDNLHGLEIDQRCVAIAVFALALEAWRYPNLPSPPGRGVGGEDAIGYRPLPKLNLAWCGQPVTGKKEQWLALANGDDRLRAGMSALYDTFRDAPVLGSLIDPARSVPEDMLTAGFAELAPLLTKALHAHAGDETWEETAIAALGLAKAAELLIGGFSLVVTNVPYRGRNDLDSKIRGFIDHAYPRGKTDLATCFLERCIELCAHGGTAALVSPQAWLFIGPYKRFRKHLLLSKKFQFIVQLGRRAFDTITGEVVNVSLTAISKAQPTVNTEFFSLNVSELSPYTKKAKALQTNEIVLLRQLDQLDNPDTRIVLDSNRSAQLLGLFSQSYKGIATGDINRFIHNHWEHPVFGGIWSPLQGRPSAPVDYGGRELVVLWENGHGRLRKYVSERLGEGSIGAWLRGEQAWGRMGIAIGQMTTLPCTIYTGELFDENTAAIISNEESNLPAIWGYCRSKEYRDEVKKLDNSSLKLPNLTLIKVPFDLAFWAKAANKRYPHGLPKPYTNDPTQWIFHGHPCGSVIWDEEKKWTNHGPLRTDPTVLQVAVARLLGYRWPAENDPDMELADEQREWVERTKTLYPFEDEDGIVCIPSIRGERLAAERLLELLHAAYGDEWHDGILTQLLTEVGGKSLEDWLRNKFFEQHCKLFHNRPFIWHIWDGRKRDGFHALVNYHRLAEGDGKGRRLLESLTYSYLGDWIARQQDGIKRGEAGAEDRLAAALELQKRLAAILEGEPPFDIFVRWKPIEEQPIGWEPDINDGVRLNIRPFMAQDIPGGKKGAGILRAKPNIKWGKDRGKEPMRDQEQFPWFWEDGKFTGERVNDVHLSIEKKHKARERSGSEKS